MTEDIKINAISPRIRYVGDGVTDTFSFNFAIFENNNMNVYIDNILQKSNYSINGVGNSNGGEVRFNTAPKQGQIITLIRNLEIKRTSDFQESGAFRAKAINHELDYQIACLQQISEQIDRSVIFPPYSQVQQSISLPSPQAGKALIWNDEENALCNSNESINLLEAKIIAARDSTLAATEEAATLNSITLEAASTAQEASEIAVKSANEAWGKISNVGDIFYTSRLDSELNGAVECNGGTYNIVDFTGTHSISNLLNLQKIPYVSLENYENILANHEEVYAFGWDGNDTFRVPTILPTLDKSNQVQYRAMIQLANGITDEALITAGSCLQQLSNKIDKTSFTDIETAINWGIPDYTAGISVSNDYTCTFPCLVVAITSQSQTLTGMTMYLNDVIINHQTNGNKSYNKRFTASVYATNGDKIRIDCDTTTNIYVYPLQGVK